MKLSGQIADRPVVKMASRVGGPVQKAANLLPRHMADEAKLDHLPLILGKVGHRQGQGLPPVILVRSGTRRSSIAHVLSVFELPRTPRLPRDVVGYETEEDPAQPTAPGQIGIPAKIAETLVGASKRGLDEVHETFVRPPLATQARGDNRMQVWPAIIQEPAQRIPIAGASGLQVCGEIDCGVRGI
jgi:hypothetical protein